MSKVEQNLVKQNFVKFSFKKLDKNFPLSGLFVDIYSQIVQITVP